MGKNNRINRAHKKRKKAKKAKIKRRRLAEKKMTLKRKGKNEGPVLTMMPNYFEGISDEERAKVADEIGKHSEETFKKTLRKLTSLLSNHDPIGILANLSTYGLTTGVSDQKVGDTSSPDRLTQAHVEICQALILQTPEKDQSWKIIEPEIIQEIWELLLQLLTSFHLQRISSNRLEMDEEELAILRLQEKIRGNTESVRNWGYFQQVVQISKELYETFDPKMKSHFGFSITELIEVFENMVSRTEQKHTERMMRFRKLFSIKNRKKLVQTYFEMADLPKSETENFLLHLNKKSYSQESLKASLICHDDLSLYENFIFNPNIIANELNINEKTIQLIFKQFSLSPGELSDHNTEFLFLNNPVWHKPLIQIEEDTFFCPIPQLFFSFIFESVDSLIETMDKKSLHNRRSLYLESKIEQIVKRRFPEANTLKSIKWKLDDRVYETDLVTHIDSYAIIIEAKSGKISDTALRGAPKRIKRHIEEYFIAPNEQSKRFKGQIEALINDQTKYDELRTILPLGENGIRKVLRLSITLENFAAIQSNLNSLKKTGWFPTEFEPCPTMTVSDLEVLFDIIEHPVQIIHYLQRRTSIEKSVDYSGDEIDLIGLYISTLFHPLYFKTKMGKMVITAMSSPIDDYYTLKEKCINPLKPSPPMTESFKNILLQLEERKPYQWAELGSILCRFGSQDQKDLFRKVKFLTKSVNKNWKKPNHKNMMILTPDESSEYALCYVLCKNQNYSKRKDFIDSGIEKAISPKHVKQVLIIGKNIDDEMPYNFIGLYRPE
ncbi:MAG: PepSY domain-containing protein [Desulfobacter sp.]